MYQFPVYNV